MHTLQSFLSQITAMNTISTICQWAFLVIALCWLWRKTNGTQLERLLKGMAIVTFIGVAIYLSKLSLFTAIVQQIIPFALIVLIVIFQPEIRRGLTYLGRTPIFSIPLLENKENINELAREISQIILAIKEMAHNRYGALIVIEPADFEHDYLSPGTPVNADISSNLILSIFFPKSPLHDGALIIQQSKIKAAGVILPITDNRKLSYIYGTRHRAALGLSEIFNCFCIIVSEETGAISSAYHGALKQYQKAEELIDPLNRFYGQSSNNNTPTILTAELQDIAKNLPQASDG